MTRRDIFHITPGRHHHRVYFFGRHLHHGFDGLIMIVIGLALVIHDLNDWPFFPEGLVKDQSSAG